MTRPPRATIGTIELEIDLYDRARDAYRRHRLHDANLQIAFNYGVLLDMISDPCHTYSRDQMAAAVAGLERARTDTTTSVPS